MSAPVVLLGPQRLRPTLVDAVERVAPGGSIAVVTAGWEERESEIDELAAHVARPVVNLRLYERTEELFVRDRAFFLAFRERRVHLRREQSLYRQRLSHAMDALCALWAEAAKDESGLAAREDALEAVRRLDLWHERRIGEILDGFEARFVADAGGEIARHRAEVAEIVRSSDLLAIAGGNVAVLLSRLRLFGVPALARSLPVVAWSAGAMALGPRIVIYHDAPPRGPGYAEIFAPGLDRAGDVLPLPHAHRRLRLDEPVRVAMFARRFAPCRPLAMADGAHFWVPPAAEGPTHGVRELRESGALEPVGA